MFETRRLRLVAFAFAAGSPVAAHALQARNITGVVVDSAGKPVAGAQVITRGSQTETRRDGRFRLLMGTSPLCSFFVVQVGFARSTVNFDTCPDTAIRVVLRRARP